MDEVISTTEQQPNKVADAARLLEKFCHSQELLTTSAYGVDDTRRDDRVAVIAAQLLAIASQAERIADALERIAEVQEEVHS